MTKTELAESMAAFLGWGDNRIGQMIAPRNCLVGGGLLGNNVLKAGTRVNKEALHQYFFSPDGFFAVRLKSFEMGYQIYRSWPIWDELGEGLEVCISEDDTKSKEFKGKYHYPKDKKLNNIEAEITAFYKAIHKIKTTNK